MILAEHNTKFFNNKQKICYLIILKMMAALYDRKISREDMQNKNYKAFKTQLKLRNNNKLIEKKIFNLFKIASKK